MEFWIGYIVGSITTGGLMLLMQILLDRAIRKTLPDRKDSK